VSIWPANYLVFYFAAAFLASKAAFVFDRARGVQIRFFDRFIQYKDNIGGASPALPINGGR